MSEPETWANPLTERYASAEMARIFSARFKFETWRRLWLWLAEEEKRLGLPISDEAIGQMRANLGRIDFEAAAREEERTRHDVMAHVYAYGVQAPAAVLVAGPWSHLRCSHDHPRTQSRACRPGRR